MESANQKSGRIQNVVIGIAVVAAAIFFWDLFKGFLIFALTLGVLVAVHEWGHFIAARMCGVRIYEFAIGMGPRAWTYWHKNGTDYTIRWLPVGGFVNLKGMQPEDPPTPDGVNGRRPAERALIYLGGPLMNMIFGIVVALTLGWLWGTPDPTIVLISGMEKRSPATKMAVVEKNGIPAPNEKPGLRIGDRIVEVNGKPVKEFGDLSNEVSTHPGKPVRLLVVRGKDQVLLEGTPPLTKRPLEEVLVVTSVPAGSPLEVGDQVDSVTLNGESVVEVTRMEDFAPAIEAKMRELAGKKVKFEIWRRKEQKMLVDVIAAPMELKTTSSYRMQGLLGINNFDVGTGPRVSLGKSVQMGFTMMRRMVEIYRHLFSRVDRLSKNVSGPVGILDAMQHVDKLPFLTYMGNLMSLSFSLALFNLFPVPVLDGGHILLLSAEVIRRRRLDPKMQQTAQLVGLLIILTLAVLITGKDLIKVFG
jgi:regulator of sigma E protease